MLIKTEQPIQQLIIWLFLKTRGGKTRTQIVSTLKKTPQNTNQLSVKLQKSYKTISHHLEVLEKYRLIVPTGDTYAKTYFLSQSLEDSYRIFEEVTSTGKGKKAKIVTVF